MNIRELKKEQARLAKKVIVKDDFDEIKLIAGCDQAFYGDMIVSAVVVLDAETLEVVEKQYAVLEAQMPYIPGFLAYRESPAILEAYNKLEQKPDLLFVDGNGVLHPRKLGMASHLGIMLDLPTVGLAKRQLLGEVVENKVVVEDVVKAEIVETKNHAKPVIVSVGHRLCLRTAVGWVKRMLCNHKLPEPLHEAHKYANKIRKRESKKTPEIKEEELKVQVE